MGAPQSEIVCREHGEALDIHSGRLGPRVQKPLRLRFVQIELLADGCRVRVIEAVSRKLLFLREPYLAISHSWRPAHVEHVIDALQIRRDAIESVGELHRNRVEILPAALLEISELRDLLTIEQHLPANSPSAQSRRLPVVF